MCNKTKKPSRILAKMQGQKGVEHKSVMRKIKTFYNNVRLLLSKHENSPCAVKIHPDRVKELNRINKNVIPLS